MFSFAHGTRGHTRPGMNQRVARERWRRYSSNRRLPTNFCPGLPVPGLGNNRLKHTTGKP